MQRRDFSRILRLNESEFRSYLRVALCPCLTDVLAAPILFSIWFYSKRTKVFVTPSCRSIRFTRCWHPSNDSSKTGRPIEREELCFGSTRRGLGRDANSCSTLTRPPCSGPGS